MRSEPVRQSIRDEQGIALVIALFMMLAMSVLGASLMFVSKTETLSSHNYRLMSQARYGAESGISQAANYLLSDTYQNIMPGSATDPGTYDDANNIANFNNYNVNVSPVTLKSNNAVVKLSWDSTQSSYPISTVKDGFAQVAHGSLDVSDAPVVFKATATLKSMRPINDAFTNQMVVIQTWEIVGEGSVTGARDATVEVSALVERQTNPIFGYAAFSVDPGCSSMSFSGGGSTDSFDHRTPTIGADGRPVPDKDANGNFYGGDVGTNGNLVVSGSGNNSQSTIINGALSTPRTGVGSCTSSNVTAETINGQATVTGGLVQLAQSVPFPTPPLPSPLPPVGTNVKLQTYSDCQAAAGSACTQTTLPAGTLDAAEGNGPFMTLNPAAAAGGKIVLGDVVTQSVLVLKGGEYNFNSLTMNAGSRIVVAPGTGQVKINIYGKQQNGGDLQTPITITGRGLVDANANFDPQDMQILYAGTGGVQLAGGEKTSALIYAPNATGRFSGGSDLYGAVVVKQLTDLGGAQIHYDRAMKTEKLTAGDYMMSAFTWKNY
jgi:Tfp pilus assembly protein PilX